MALRSGSIAVFLGALLTCAGSGAGASSLERFAEFIAKTRTARGQFEQKIFDRNPAAARSRGESRFRGQEISLNWLLSLMPSSSSATVPGYGSMTRI
jgi:hypothetical protein